MAAYKNPIPSVDLDPPKTIDVDPIVNDYTEKESVYFAFIDVLGFKKAFENNNQKDTYFAEKFREVFIYYFDLMGAANFTTMAIDRNLCYAGQTSDSLYFYTEKSELLIEFLKIFSHLNVYAMTQDVFFRGGIAKGSLFYKQSYQFYGDSVINAYLLESEISKNPIIVIDENTYKDINSLSESKSLIFEDKGRHFLRPFAYLEGKFALDINKSVAIREIDKIQLDKMIEQNKSKFEYDARNYEKYVFLFNKYDEYKKNFEIE